MKKGSGVVSVVGLLAAAGAARADVVTDWNGHWRETIRVVGGGPCPISRAGAMMNVAIYDAVNSVSGEHRPYLAYLTTPLATSEEAAAASAAHRVLVALYPARQAIYDAALASSLAAIPDGPAKTAGIDLGVRAADAILAARASDGTADPMPYTPGKNPGEWRQTPPDYSDPHAPGWGSTTPWSMITGAQFRPPLPAGFMAMELLLASPEYAAQVNEVKSLGELNSTTRTAYEFETAWFWANDRNGTFKPPGHLNYITEVVSEDRSLTLRENARLFALISIGMGDAGLVAWDCKFNSDIDLWRPVTAIREADTDGNPLTVADPLWLPLLPFSPPFPAYTSGHATFAAVHAKVMERFLGTDDVTFTITSDDAPGVFRTYTRFSSAAVENARSRVFLGVHYQFDADFGNASGTALGEHVMDTKLLPACDADFDGSGVVDVQDFLAYLNAFSAAGARTDANGDGALNVGDLLAFMNAYSKGCP